jgi:hypothetical protein
MTQQNSLQRRAYVLLFLLGIVIALAAARLQPVPGYMDAEYYYSGAVRLYQGYGLTQPFLWNYLDEPAGLPHASHTYWMPLASLLGAAGMRLAGSEDFFSARLVFIVLAGLLPPLTAWFSLRLSGKRGSALLAGLLAAFPGYYLVYTSNTENFTLYMILGSLFLMTAFLGKDHPYWLRFSLLGVLAGFMHLTRADGLLWLLVTPVIVLVWSRRKQNGVAGAVKMMGLVLVGYSLVMSPWFARNLDLYGGLFPAGGSRALWLTDYNQTYHYPADEITLSSWLSAGWQHHLQSRLHALRMNLQNMLAVQGSVFLLPLILAGLWRMRDLAVVRLGVFMWLVTLGVMTVVFPFAGWRGGFLHSGAALQPLWWAAAPVGLDAFIGWGVRRRGWNARTAGSVFSTALVVLSLLLSLVLFVQNVYGADPQQMAWRAGHDQYRTIDAALPGLGVRQDDVLMVNNPPGLYSASRRPSIVVPDGTEETVLVVAERYGAKYLVLDQNYPSGLKQLFMQPGNRPGLTFLASINGTHVFRID